MEQGSKKAEVIIKGDVAVIVLTDKNAKTMSFIPVEIKGLMVTFGHKVEYNLESFFSQSVREEK